MSLITREIRRKVGRDTMLLHIWQEMKFDDLRRKHSGAEDLFLTLLRCCQGKVEDIARGTTDGYKWMRGKTSFRRAMPQ